MKRGEQRPPYSDLDLTRWKEYDDLLTGSLWLLGPRAKDGPHVGDYWGNFVPQIPNQVLRRFTRQGETVVAPFLEKNGIQHLAIFLDPKSAATSELGAQGLPTSYLVARDGTIVGKEEGGATWDSSEMVAKLTPYLDAK